MTVLQSPLDSRDTRCDLALARATLHRFLALAFRKPGDEWRDEVEGSLHGARVAAATCVECGGAPAALVEALEQIAHAGIDADAAAAEHARWLGPDAPPATCPHETERPSEARPHGDELRQFHEIADIGAYYDAFCLELGGRGDERADHVSVELEFLHYLSVKEAWAEEQGIDDLATLCRDTSRRFLAEHLATWASDFAASLEARVPASSFYVHAARVLSIWVADDPRRLAEGAVGRAT